MSKSRLTRFKKIVLCFSVVVSLCFTNFALFSVRASANVVVGDSASVYTSGAPLGLYCEIPSSGSSGVNYRGFLPSVNVYALSNTQNDDNYRWIGSIESYSGNLDADVFSVTFRDNPSLGADIDFHFVSDSFLTFSLMSPLIFSTDIEQRFNTLLTLVSPDTTLSYVTANYSFKFSSPTSPSGYSFVSYSYNEPISGGNATFRPFPLQVFNNLPSYSVDSFLDSSNNPYYVLLDAQVSFSAPCDNFYINATSSSIHSFADYQTLINNRFNLIFDVDTVIDNTSFDDIDWSSWLVSAVSGFMNFQLVPGLSFAGILGLLVGMSLFIVFLKVFAGG